MKKYISIIKVEPLIYKLDKYSDDSMFTLYMCLTDGLGSDSYVKFLEDDQRVRFGGNICNMDKSVNLVSLAIDEDIIPNLPVFKISISNLIKIYKEIARLKDLGVSRINITLDNDVLCVSSE